MKTELKTIGIDVSKASITTHILTHYPNGGLKSYWDKSRNKSSVLYPSFHSSPDTKKKQKSTFDFADYVIEEKPEIAVMEPTGNHYSRIWYSILKTLNIKVLWVGHVELRRYRGGKNLPNKSDAADALAMAAYALDPDHWTEESILNERYFLMHRPDGINQLRELCQQLEHLNRVQNPIINYARQLLSWQFPEVAHQKSVSTKKGTVPPLWGWLGERSSEVSPAGLTRLNNRYKESIATTYKIEIDPILRLHADWLCDISVQEERIEASIEKLISSEEFSGYNQIFDKFGFGLRVRARLLSRVYPFNAFLGIDGKAIIEYELREVKRVERERRNGQNTIKRSPGDTKRIKRNRSRDTFKMRIGMGTILEQSGDMLVEKPSGSSLCRMSLWQFVLTAIETNKVPENHITKEILNYKDTLKSNCNEQGEKLLNGKHLQSKLMSKIANMLFQEFNDAKKLNKL